MTHQTFPAFFNSLDAPGCLTAQCAQTPVILQIVAIVIRFSKNYAKVQCVGERILSPVPTEVATAPPQMHPRADCSLEVASYSA